MFEIRKSKMTLNLFWVCKQMLCVHVSINTISISVIVPIHFRIFLWVILSQKAQRYKDNVNSKGSCKILNRPEKKESKRKAHQVL